MSTFSEVKIHKVESGSEVLAFVSCKVNTEAGSVKLNSIALVKGINGLRLSYPKRKPTRDGQTPTGFEDYFYFETGPREELESLATELYYSDPTVEKPKPKPRWEEKKAEFPQLIKYKDTNEFVVVDSWAEVDRNRPFELA